MLFPAWLPCRVLRRKASSPPPLCSLPLPLAACLAASLPKRGRGTRNGGTVLPHSVISTALGTERAGGKGGLQLRQRRRRPSGGTRQRQGGPPCAALPQCLCSLQECSGSRRRRNQSRGRGLRFWKGGGRACIPRGPPCPPVARFVDASRQPAAQQPPAASLRHLQPRQSCHGGMLSCLSTPVVAAPAGARRTTSHRSARLVARVRRCSVGQTCCVAPAPAAPRARQRLPQTCRFGRPEGARKDEHRRAAPSRPETLTAAALDLRHTRSRSPSPAFTPAGRRQPRVRRP